LYQLEFFVKPKNTSRSTIRIISVGLPKSPTSFAWGDEVPQVSTRKPLLRLSEFWMLYTPERASKIAEQVTELARGNGYPLRCIVEPSPNAW